MKADPQKLMQFQQQERAFRLRQEADALVQEFNGDLEAEKKQLLAQVKADVNAIDTIQGSIRDAKGELEEAKAKLKSLESDLQELTGDRIGKYKQLEQRDQEMQTFIDNFDSEKKKQLGTIRETEDSIVHLLEHIAEGLAGGGDSRLNEMREELDGMIKVISESSSTHVRLENELEIRKNDLKKLNSLDGKILAELEAVNKRISEHETGMKKFSDLDGLRQEHEDLKKRLSVKKVHLSSLRIHLKKQVQQLNNDYSTKRDELQSNDVHQPLQLQEQKLRQLKQNLFQLDDFVKAKNAETHFLPLKAECMRMTDETNTFLKDPKRLEKTGSRGKAF